MAKIADVTFTSADRSRDVIRNFNTDSFDSLSPKCKGEQPKTSPSPNPGRSGRSPSPPDPTRGSDRQVVTEILRIRVQSEAVSCWKRVATAVDDTDWVRGLNVVGGPASRPGNT